MDIIADGVHARIQEDGPLWAKHDKKWNVQFTYAASRRKLPLSRKKQIDEGNKSSPCERSSICNMRAKEPKRYASKLLQHDIRNSLQHIVWHTCHVCQVF